MIKKDKYLSASRIKTLESCSYLYFLKYSDPRKLPDTTSDGARRGVCAHAIFEYLLKPKHKHFYDEIITNKTITKSPAIMRYMRLLMRKEGLGEKSPKGEDNFEMVDSMILVGLNWDYFCVGKNLYSAETEIKIETDEYKLIGYIDKMAEKDGVLYIYDYKSSAKKEENIIQAMCYGLYSKRVKQMDAFLKFIYLRFPKDPEVNYNFSDKELNGFELYLKQVYKLIQKFDEKDALSNLAAQSKTNRWLCGFNKTPGALKKDGNLMWGCQYKFPFIYYALMEGNKIIKTAYKQEELAPAANQKIVEKYYAGCPAFNRVRPFEID